jgi:hypothetical protein
LEKIQRRRTEELLLIFIYPAGVIVEGITYGGNKYNFLKHLRCPYDSIFVFVSKAKERETFYLF